MSLPNLANPVRAYLQPLKFGIVTKEIIDHEEQEVVKYVKTRGVRQPLPPQRLEIYQTGQRAWKWECLHLLPNKKTDLKPDDVVIFDKVRYRVIEKYDCTEYGYIEYLIAQTFEDEEESI